ncbi:hypothetical protein SMICM304S_04630 [Streptomyces microflavus]
MSAQRCLTAWNAPMGRPNCSRTAACATAVSRLRAAVPQASAARRTAARSRTRSGSRAGSRGRTRCSGTWTASARTSAVGRVGSTLRCGRTVSPSAPASTRNQRSPSGVTAGRSSRSAASAERTGGAVPSRRWPPGAGVAVRVPEVRARAAVRSPEARPRIRSPVPGPTARRTTSPTRAVARQGPGSEAWAASSRTTARSRRPPPPPPYSSGRWIPVSPCPASASQWAGRTPGAAGPPASRSLRTSPGGAARASHPRTECASARCSSVMPMPVPMPMRILAGRSHWNGGKSRTRSIMTEGQMSYVFRELPHRPAGVRPGR